VDGVLCDLGSSMSFMPLSMCKKLDLGEMRPTTISLELANCYVKYPIGVLEDILTTVGDLYLSVDFMILEMEKDMHTVIILGWPLLATAGCRANVLRMVNCLLMWGVIM